MLPCPSLHASYFVRINAGGFGNPHNTGGLDVKTMAVFQGRLYAGVANQGEGAQIWCFDGTSWQQINKSGFGSRDNSAIASMTATDKILYASTSSRTGGQVWRYDGRDWSCIHRGAFGKTLANTINSMAVYKKKLYVGLWDQVTSKPAEIWAYDTDASWHLVNTPGFGSPHNLNVTALAAARVNGQEKLYAVAWKTFKYTGPDAGCDVWAYDEKTWTKVNAGREGFGQPGKGRAGMEPFSLAEFQGKLYVGLWAFGAGMGWEVWAYDGKDWVLANPDRAAAGTPLRLCIALTPCNGRLYAAITDAFKDFELWSGDGSSWTKIIGDQCATSKKLGMADNLAINAMAAYQGHLYLGVTNNRTGYQVWESRFPEIAPRTATLALKDAELYSLPSGAPPVTWASSNPAVAAIDPHTGYAQALSAGKSVITATDMFGYRASALEVSVTPKAGTAAQHKLLIFSEAVPAAVSNSGKDSTVIAARVYASKAQDAIDSVAADLAPLKLGILRLTDDGQGNDAAAGDSVFSRKITLPAAVPAGTYPCTITARTRAGAAVQASCSLMVTQTYTVPEIVSVKTMGGAYHIPIMFDLKKPDQQLCSATVEYRKGRGPWRPASIASASGVIMAQGAQQPGSSGAAKTNVISQLPTPLPVNHYVCVWQSEKDIGESAGLFTVRVTPADSTSSGTAAESAPFALDNRTLPADEMVYVPTGKFFIDKYEYPNHAGYYPLVSRTWFEARNTCQDLGKDLCTTAQWEAAYYGSTKKRYPYGNAYDSRDRAFCNTQGSADQVTVPSGIYEHCVNDLGIYDMGGNVYEWTGLDEQQVFMADQSHLSNAMAQSLFNVDDPAHRHEYLGFRCCRCEGK